MRIFKDTYKNKDGTTKKTKRWYLDFRDHLKRRHYLAGYVDKKATRDLAGQIESLISCRGSNGSMTIELQRWLELVPDTMKMKFVKWGLVDAQRVEGGKLLSIHLQDWKKSILDSGKTGEHARRQYNRVKFIFSGFNFYSEIQASKVQSEIAKLKKTVRARNDKGKMHVKIIGDTSQKTKNYYLKAAQQYCRWMVQDGRSIDNPLKHLTVAKAQSEKRAALEPEELRELLTHTEPTGTSYSLTGRQRITVYRVAAETGFRASEIDSLKVSDFNLVSGDVTLEGDYTKNSKDTTIPLRQSTVEMLKESFSGKLPKAKAFKMPYLTNLARMLRKDLQAAGVEIDPDRGVVEFHSLRHSFGTMLAAAGVHPKTAQQLMRHSDINLTMSRYTHVLRGQERNAIENLPDLDKLPQSQRQIKTGTDINLVDAISDVRSSPSTSPIKSAKHSKTMQNIAKQEGNTGQIKNPVFGGKIIDFTAKNEISNNWAHLDSNVLRRNHHKYSTVKSLAA
jgi:integrase